MSKWFEFYKDRMKSTSYEEYFKKKYEPFLKYLQMNICPCDKVAELGCGTSLVTRLIYNGVSEFLVYDNDPNMLELSSMNLEGTQVKKKLYDITKPLRTKFDLIYSHGVLEHFEPEQIREIVKNQLRICNHLVHYVPSSKYEKPSFGDERLWSPELWKALVDVPEVIEFNDGYDLILIWRSNVRH